MTVNNHGTTNSQGTFTVVTKIHFERKAAGRKSIAAAPAPTPSPRVPRVAKLMALAIRYQNLLRDGTVKDQSDLARLAHVTQPRMTQIMNLLHLAPDIQEALLFLPPATGRDRIHERMLRPLTAIPDWNAQRTMWANLHPAMGNSGVGGLG